MASENVNVRVTGELRSHLQQQVGIHGLYENASEYIRDLIRRDKNRADQQAFDRLKAELTLAFSEPDNSYAPLSASEVINRNQAPQS